MQYAFNDRGVAEELKRFANERLGTTNHPRTASGNEVILVKAPAAGIVGIDGTTITAGTCTKVYIDMSGADPATAEDDSVEMSVLNTTSDDIAGDSIFQAARLGSLWVSVAGGGGGSAPPNYLCQAPVGGVPARSGSNASQTDCDIYEINASSGAISSTGDTISIYNVWSQGIASNAYFTAKQVDGVYVPDAEDCTGN